MSSALQPLNVERRAITVGASGAPTRLQCSLSKGPVLRGASDDPMRTLSTYGSGVYLTRSVV